MSEHLVWISIVDHDSNAWVGGVMGTVNDFEDKLGTPWNTEVIELAELAGAMPANWRDLCVATVSVGPLDGQPLELVDLPRWTLLHEDDLERAGVRFSEVPRGTNLHHPSAEDQ